MNLSPSGTQKRRPKPNAKKRRRLRGDFDDDLPELTDDPNVVTEASSGKERSRITIVREMERILPATDGPSAEHAIEMIAFFNNSLAKVDPAFSEDDAALIARLDALFQAPMFANALQRIHDETTTFAEATEKILSACALKRQQEIASASNLYSIQGVASSCTISSSEEVILTAS